jgi:hypothetical protein
MAPLRRLERVGKGWKGVKNDRRKMFHPFCVYFFHHATNVPARRTHLSRSNFGKSPVIAPRRAGVHYPADRLASPPPKPTPSPAAASPSPSPRLSLPPQRRLAVTSPPRPPGSRSSSPLLALSSRRPRQPGGGAGERGAVPLPLSPPIGGKNGAADRVHGSRHPKGPQGSMLLRLKSSASTRW